MQNQVLEGFRLSPQQRRLWLQQEAAYAQPWCAQLHLLIEGDLDMALMRRVLQDLVDRHEILRTTFQSAPGMKIPLQAVAGSQPLAIAEHDLAGLDAAEQDAYLTQLFDEAVAWPFDLAAGPTLHLSLTILGPGRHMLFLRLPALCADAAALNNLVREIARVYEAAARVEDLTDEPVQYIDLSEWQNELLESEDTEEGRDYWRRRRGTATAARRLPFEQQRSSSGFVPRSVDRVLSPEALAGLERLAGELEVPLSALLLACWQVLLRRLTGEPEVEVGTACDGRKHDVLQGALGLLTRHLPLRLRMEGEDRFDAVVRQVNRLMGEVSRWQEYFDGEAEAQSTPEAFGFEYTDFSESVPAASVNLRVVRHHARVERFGLKLACVLGQGSLAVGLQFDAGLYEEADVQRLAGQLQALVGGMLADPAAAVDELEILDEQERRLLLVDWNDTARDYQGGSLLHRMFEAQVARTPGDVAVVFETAELTYAELDAHANRLAWRLRELGAGPEALIGVCAERSLEMVVAVIAVLKAGAAFLPLDPSYPRPRLAFMLEDARVSVLLTQQRLLASLPEHRAHVLCLDAKDTEALESVAGPDVDLDPGSLAYVIYTSGSTGNPKGVMISHRAVCNHLHWAQEVYGLTGQDRTLQKTPLSFDVAIRELFWPLTSGARLIVARPDGHQDSRYLTRLAIEQGITVLNFVPSMLQVLLEEPDISEARSLRRVLAGGEALPPSLRDRFFERLAASLHNQYGPTETAVTATFWTCRPDDRRAGVPIGRPIANARAYVLDARLGPVPLGVLGELYVGGTGLSRGYLDRPVLTAERFVPDPFSGVPGERLYRTGDLVRWLPEGGLEFLGRIDHQVKIRGLRIELGEIEVALAAHPQVRQALVVAREDAGGGKQLVAYVVPHRDQPLQTADLRHLLQERLPEFMVPAVFVALDELPLTPSGKVDRQAFPEPPEADVETAMEVTTPRTLVEELLAGIWSQLLDKRRIGVHDDFFQLGGHSLLGTQLISRIREALRVDLPLRSLFEAPTLAGLAAKIEAKIQGGGPALPTVEPAPRDGRLLLSFAQQRLWFLDQLEPGSPVYNMPGAVRFSGRLDVGVMAHVLTEIVRRHEALRTVFPTRAGQPEQIVLPASPVPLPVVDLGGLDAGRRESEAWRLAEEEARRPFDLARGPLLRVSLLRFAPEEHLAVMTMHHIVSDGWSRGVFVREMVALHRAFAAGCASPLPELPVQYADYAQWQRRWLTEELLEADMAYWRRHLTGGPAVLRLPTDRPRPVVHRYRGGRVPVALSTSLSEALAELGQGQGVTLFMSLLAAFQTLLLRYTGQAEIRVGTPISGRDQVEIEGLIGFFVNTLVLSSNLTGDPSFAGLLRRVRDVALDAHAHQNAPFERLVDELQPERDLARTPLFQVALVLQNAPQEVFELPGLRLQSVELKTGTAKFDLTLTFAETADGLRGSLEYNSDLFEEATARRMLQHFRTLLEGAATVPEARLYELPLLEDGERRQLLAGLASAAEEHPVDCLGRLFEEQAARTPRAVAVRFQEGELTYGELNVAANRLAHHLLSAGIGPENLVGLCLEPSLDLLIGVLGILKAGAAYMPMDPTYPVDRLAFLLEDSRVQALVTQERLLAQLPRDRPWVVFLDADRDLIARAAAENPPSLAVPESPAYVIYTSGSTGRPKGVVVTHANVARLFAATRPWFRFGEQDVWTLFHSYAFDFSVWEIWGALLFGGRLVVVPHGTSRWPEAFLRLLADERVTVLSQTPSAFRQLVRAAVEAETVTPLALRFVIFGGEALELRSLEPWFRLYGDESPRLVNMYGITETTVHVTYRPLAGPDVETPGSLIGGPIPDLRIHVLDPVRGLVPVGVPGEMYVAGAGLARGYLNRPALTAERFVPDPFSEPGARLYRTGDLARYLPNGDVEYLGRIDEQVKIRGFRIELGEIESVLAAHPAVAEATVLVREDVPGERRLVAYIVPAPGEEPTAGALRRAAGERLPEYMVPSAFVLLAAMPLTANGKLDRRALPTPDECRPDLEETYMAPENPVEEVLAGIWSQVLRVEKVGVHDSFFALGGDSILSIRVVALANERGLGLTLQQLFQHQTISELAPQVQLVEEDQAALAGSAPFELVSEADRRKLPDGVDDAYPLTMLQAGMLYHMQLAEADFPYHNVDSWHIRGRLEPLPLEQAVRYVVSRHPVLRTSFDLTTYGEPLQLVHRTVESAVAFEDLRSLAFDEQEEAVEEFLRDVRAKRLDIACPPLLRFHVYLRSADTFQFTLIENHAILDGWSLHSTLSEAFDLYSTLLEGAEPSNEPELSVAFRDFVLLERQAMASEESRRYWAEKLADRTFLELPRWPASGRKEGPQVGIRRAPISPELSDGLRRTARELALPLKSVLLAAHVKVMSLVSGQTDVITGLVSNGRPEVAGGERVRGLYLNTLPFRLRLPSGSWTELAQAVFATEREMLPHRRYPLALLQQGEDQRDLFEVSFNYVHFHVLDGALRPGAWEILHARIQDPTNFTFSATFGQDPGTARVFLQAAYDLSELTQEQTLLIEGLYVKTLRALVADPGARHDGFFPLAGHERHRLLVEWNDTTPVSAGLACVHELFTAQAVRTPERMAVTFEDQGLSFAGLDARANRLAHRLMTMGIGPEARVAFCLEPSLEMPVAILGILKAGGAYVPLDPSYPRERLRYLLEDSRASLLLTQKRLLGELPESAVPTLFLDEEEGVSSFPEVGAPRVEVHPHNLAYVIYTSGSTGQPNGAMISHRGLANYLLWATAEYKAEAGTGAPLHTSIGFDLTITSLFPPLLAGRAVVLLPQSPGSTALADALAATPDFSLLKITPAHLAVMREQLPSEALGEAVRTVVIGGEALQGEDLALWRSQSPCLRLINEYGPTETVVGCAVYEVPVGMPEPGPVPIGRPIGGMEIYLLSADLQPVPAGTPGELYIGGVGLGRGYLNRPGLTAERWIPHPFTGLPGERLYRTGDLARHSRAGELLFLGRVDHQVKIRGYRIELGEVKAVLEQHPEVREVFIGVRESAPGDTRLMAYIVPVSGSMAPPGDLADFANRYLPAHMIPSRFVGIEALPLTTHGKVDRRALPVPEEGNDPSGAAGPAANPIQEFLLEIWRDLLQTEDIGIHESFFDIGGHSLLATRLVARVSRAFGVELPLRALFDTPTVAQLAARIESVLQGGERLAAPSIEPAPRDVFLPLSFAQQRLWFIDQLEPGNHAYNMPTAVRLDGAIDTAAMERSLEEVQRRHETLRTAFVTLDGEPRQVIAPAGPRSLPVVDIAALPVVVREPLARQLAREEATRPFDLARGPMMRTILLRLDHAESVLLLTLHHIISDGWSMGLLIRELTTLYEVFSARRPSPLPVLPVQYADFAYWQRQWLQGEVMEQLLGYWRRQLGGTLPVLWLPFERSRPAVLSSRGGQHAFVMSPEVTTRLKRLSRDEQVTLFMTALAAFKTLLYRCTGQTDVVVGTDVAGRGRAETEALIGFFVNLLVLRSNLAGSPSFRELLHRVREVALAAYAHQDLPFDKLVEELAPGKGLGHSPLFQVLFVFQAPGEVPQIPGLTLSPFVTGSVTSRFDLGLFMRESERGLEGTWNYRTDLFAADAVSRLSAQLETLLTSIAETPDTRLDDLNLLTEQEHRERSMELEGREKASFAKFKGVKPKAVSLPHGDLIRTGYLQPGSTFPLLVEPNAPDLDLSGWAKASGGFIEENLMRHGAILFRGFGIGSVAEFERFAGSVCSELFGEYGDLPRAGEGKKVYNSTPYPSTKTILFHSESSHMHQWPMRQFFYCVLPSESGGETPIVDCRRIYQRLEPELRQRFEQQGLLYVRNFTGGLDVSWQDFFRTDDRQEVEEYCRSNGIEFEWKGDTLQTRQWAPAVIRHPKSGEPSFFNQIQLHHTSCMEPELRESLASLFSEQDLPRNVYYGDGTPIEDEVVQTILDLYWEEAASFPWQTGDVLMLDNMLVAHARNPYEGPRKIAVAMGDMFRKESLAAPLG